MNRYSQMTGDNATDADKETTRSFNKNRAFVERVFAWMFKNTWPAVNSIRHPDKNGMKHALLVECAVILSNLSIDWKASGLFTPKILRKFYRERMELD